MTHQNPERNGGKLPASSTDSPEPSNNTATWHGGAAQLDLDLPARWRPIRLLGRGGQAEVWLAEDTELGLEVAVKVMTVDNKDSSQAARLRREVRTARDVAHPHLIRIFELVENGSNLAIIMEFLPGGTVSEQIKQGPMPAETAVKISEQVLDALAALHHHGIVHRDIKPSNILLDDDGAAKLADLGTVRPVAETSALTRTAAQVGTPAYMSPEQLRGENVGPPSDLYSLGVTLYRMLTGDLPFQAKSDFALAHHHLNSTPAPVRERCRSCPRWLARFTERLLEKKAADRWADAAEALIALRRREPGRSDRARRRLGGWVAAISAAGVAGLAWWMLAPGPGLKARVIDRQVVVSDDRGSELWRRPAYRWAGSAVVADFLSEAGLEVASAEPPTGERKGGFDLVISDRDGKALARCFVNLVNPRLFPAMSPRFGVRLEVFDLNHDGMNEVVFLAGHREWYPSLLGLWQPDREENARRLIEHAGVLHNVDAADLDGDGLDELITSGVNNSLGFQTVIAVLDPRSGKGATSPDLFAAESYPEEDLRTLRSYLVLGDYRLSPMELEATSTSITLTKGDDQLTFGPDSALFEPAAEGVRTFWINLAEAKAAVAVNPLNLDAQATNLSEHHPNLWLDPSFRAATAFSLALAAAEGGAPITGADHIASTLADGVELRRMHRVRGELLLIANQARAGEVALRQGINLKGQGFAASDEIIDLALLAALEVNEDLAGDSDEMLRAMFSSEDHRRRQLGVVQSFMAGDFASCEAEVSYPYGSVYGAEVLRYWARLESGGNADTELERLAQVPETRELAHLALARAAFLDGRTAEASNLAEEALWQLRERSRTSWPDYVWRVLGEWVVGTILEANGNPSAAQHLTVASKRAPLTFFGRAITEATRLNPEQATTTTGRPR